MKAKIPILAAVITLAASTLYATDVSGKWVGSMPSGSSTGAPTATIYLNLVQQADAVTGTVAYQDESRQAAIENPALKGDQLTFEVHDNPNKIVRFRFTVSERALDGEGASGDRVMKIKLTRP